MGREKKPVIVNITSVQAEQSFAAFNNSSSKLKALEGKIELEITKIREKYQKEVDQYKKDKEASFAILQTYALENEGLFDKKKSYDMTHGRIGFRTGTPALKNQKGFTWEAVKNLVKEFIGSDYVRTKEEVDKEKLLAERDNEQIAGLFPKCGIEVRQDETFFVEPKEEVLAAA